MLVRSLRAVSLCIAAALALSGCVSKSQLATLQSQMRTLEEENKALASENHNIQATLREAASARAAAEEELARLQERLGIKPRAALASTRGKVAGAYPDLARDFTCLAFEPKLNAYRFTGEIVFDSGKIHLRPAAQRQLDQLAEMMRSESGQGLRLVVVGHTDDRPMSKKPGRDVWKNNRHLSTERANEVADYLAEAGVPGAKLVVMGHGEFQPRGGSLPADDRAVNRRVEIYVVDDAAPIFGSVP
jgi:chemotaxis protein MotB